MTSHDMLAVCLMSTAATLFHTWTVRACGGPKPAVVSSSRRGLCPHVSIISRLLSCQGMGGAMCMYVGLEVARRAGCFSMEDTAALLVLLILLRDAFTLLSLPFRLYLRVRRHCCCCIPALAVSSASRGPGRAGDRQRVGRRGVALVLGAVSATTRVCGQHTEPTRALVV